MRKERGFTFIEVLFVLFFGLLVFGVIFAVLSTGRDMYQTADAKIEVQDNLRKGMDRMIKELKGASSLDGTIFDAEGRSVNLLRFTTGGNTVEYSVIPGDLLIRTEGGNTQVLATHISAATFTLLSDNSLTIELRGQKQTANGREVGASLISSVALRN